MDELFLRKHNSRRISPLVQEKRAQGSPRLCNHDYIAAYVEVEYQVRPCVSFTALRRVCRAFECQELELVIFVRVRAGNYEKIYA